MSHAPRLRCIMRHRIQAITATAAMRKRVSELPITPPMRRPEGHAVVLHELQITAVRMRPDRGTYSPRKKCVFTRSVGPTGHEDQQRDFHQRAFHERRGEECPGQLLICRLARCSTWHAEPSANAPYRIRRPVNGRCRRSCCGRSSASSRCLMNFSCLPASCAVSSRLRVSLPSRSS